MVGLQQAFFSSRRLGSSLDPAEGERFVGVCFTFLYIVLPLSVIWFVGIRVVSHLHRGQASSLREKVGDALSDFTDPESKHGAFGWRGRRGPHLFGTLYVTTVMLPFSLLAISCAFGPLLAIIEDWPHSVGIQYFISNALGFFDPLTDDVPSTTAGQVVDIFMSVLTFVMVNATMGTVANMAFIQEVTDAMPQTVCGFFRLLCLYIPIGVMGLSAAVGGGMAYFEDWSFWDGFRFMISSAAGLANPLTAAYPETAEGCFLEAWCICIELTMAGAVIGIIGSHPATSMFIDFIDGKDPEASGAGTGGKEPEVSHSDTDESADESAESDT